MGKTVPKVLGIRDLDHSFFPIQTSEWWIIYVFSYDQREYRLTKWTVSSTHDIFQHFFVNELNPSIKRSILNENLPYSQPFLVYVINYYQEKFYSYIGSFSFKYSSKENAHVFFTTGDNSPTLSPCIEIKLSYLLLWRSAIVQWCRRWEVIT